MSVFEYLYWIIPAYLGPPKSSDQDLILDSLVDGVLVINSNHQVERWNSTFLDLFHLKKGQLSRGQLVGTLWSVLDPVVSQAVDEHIRNPNNRWTTVVGSELKLKNGMDLELDIIPFESSSGELKTLIQIRDISRLKNVEREALEAASIKSRFLANMSHEIRTPLNGIIGILDLYKYEEDSQKKGEYLEMIEASSEHLLEIVNDILDLSKIEAGKLNLETVPFDLNTLLTEIYQLVKPHALKKDLKLSFPTTKNLGLYLGDPIRIKQILTNLLSNAVKFTDSGEVRLILQSQGDLIRFNVQDTGIGISKEKQERLFRPFTQVDSSMKRRFEGTGLGLAISARLADMMGGAIDLSSIPGKGTTFWFEIKLEKASHILHLEQNRGARGLSKNTRILVAEDNPVNQTIVSEMLKKLGAQVTIAQDGVEALEALNKHSYNCVLMDCMMPRMDGFETTTRIREIPLFKHLPIIALTANAMAGDREACLLAGMNDYLSKPLVFEKLQSVLEKWIVTETSRSDFKMDVSDRVKKSYYDELHRLSEVLPQLIKTQDAKRILHEIHQLKATSDLMSDTEISRLSHELDRDLRTTSDSIPREVLNRLEELSLRVCSASKEVKKGA